MVQNVVVMGDFLHCGITAFTKLKDYFSAFPTSKHVMCAHEVHE